MLVLKNRSNKIINGKTISINATNIPKGLRITEERRLPWNIWIVALVLPHAGHGIVVICLNKQ